MPSVSNASIASKLATANAAVADAYVAPWYSASTRNGMVSVWPEI